MKNQNFKFLIPIVATILLGLSSFALISIVELKVHLGMLTEDILSIDKQIGRIYHHMDRLMENK
jgi:hypothetical protein|tara:strand:- start:70 stop:261 length:192 start_codon:yes stop_codon:yes gene_type:complete